VYVRHSDVIVRLGETFDYEITPRENHDSLMNERIAWRILCGRIILCSHQELSDLLSADSSYHSRACQH
jgi:hypothetical protein